jgi:catechol 2,3-dioxygenase-like lactoylglutathione lyase family enzyme
MVLARYPIRASVPVSDLDRARAFYSDVLGLELAEEIEGEALHYRCGEGTWLEVFRARSGVGCGHTEAGFGVTDIEEVVAALRERGVVFEEYDLGAGVVTVAGIVEMGGHKAAWFTDPDGNVIGIFEED